MIYSSLIREEDAHLVLDASVMINLHACGHGRDILASLARPAIVTEEVLQELCVGGSKTPREREFANALISDGQLILESTIGEPSDIYFELLSDPRSLDDGEASTLAVAIANGYVPVIDERKARRELTDFRNKPEPPNSLDLFTHKAALAKLGENGVASAVYSALRKANMRVRLDQREFVLELIGRERAVECNSLPNFKSLKPELEQQIIDGR
tara:strand:- start:17517 stop:18155 length:639 start_codon:yes stop_codon:yes gene_type:complete